MPGVVLLRQWRVPAWPWRVDDPHHGCRLRSVALVGIDGSGKTTQGHRLAEELTRAGVPAHYWRNAGGRRWFGRLAHRLGRGADAERLVGRSGMLLIESVLRWLAIARALLRSLVARRVAVMDRYSICQYASIRAHRPARAGRWERLARLLYRVFPEPDVTFLLRVDPQEAYWRIERRGTDHESLEFLTAADAAYRSLPEHARLVVIDANAGPDEVHREIRQRLAGWLPPSTSRVDDAASSAAVGPGVDRAATPGAEPTEVVAFTPARTPVRWRHWLAPTRRWRGNAPPRQSRPAAPSGSGPPLAARPGSPAYR